MSRYMLSLIIVLLVAAPCHAQLLKKLEQELMQGQQGGMGQNMMGGGGTPAGQTTLPPGQYMMTNMQTGQGFYVMVQNGGQMYVSQAKNGQQQGMMGGASQMMGGQSQMMPGQYPMQQQSGSGVGGMMKNFLKNELSPQGQPQMPVQQY